MSTEIDVGDHVLLEADARIGAVPLVDDAQILEEEVTRVLLAVGAGTRPIPLVFRRVDVELSVTGEIGHAERVHAAHHTIQPSEVVASPLNLAIRASAEVLHPPDVPRTELLDALDDVVPPI